MRTVIHKTIENPEGFTQKLLKWAQQFREIVYLDGNDYPQKYSSFDCALAIDALTSIKTDFHNAFDDLEEYRKTTNDWIFGYLSYDLKNDVEELKSENFDGLGFADMFFFQPKKLFFLRGNQLEVRYLRMCDDELDEDFTAIENQGATLYEPTNDLEISQRISKQEYLQKVGTMKAHIQRGDIYEANFCMEFFAENASIHPLATFRRLNSISLPPFVGFFRNSDKYLLCCSPERFLRKQGNKIISQPIKGTARRLPDEVSDREEKQRLVQSEKERSENIMIVDLVRNDLSKIAAVDSVTVEELCAPYTFSQVHHLISTVSCVAREGVSPTEIIKNAFPMGSMTGAPKISAMKIIEQLEETRRGLYSGALGYFTPDGNFDFNVVIRSILYNSSAQYLSFSVGSAITDKSDPELEYDECLLKAAAMHKVLKK